MDGVRDVWNNEGRDANTVIYKSFVVNQFEYHCPPLSLVLSTAPFLTLVVRTASLSFFIEPTFLVPEDVLFAIRMGFSVAANLFFDGGGTFLDWELDVLRKEVDETFNFLLREGASLYASVSAPRPVTPFISSPLRPSSESETRMGMGIDTGTFSVPLATGRAPILVVPEPPTFFFLATGCSDSSGESRFKSNLYCFLAVSLLDEDGKFAEPKGMTSELANWKFLLRCTLMRSAHAHPNPEGGIIG